MRVRIIKRTFFGRSQYIIQQKHSLFWWWWVDAWINDGSAWCTDDFDTFEEAEKNLCRFDGTPVKEEVIYERK